MVRLVVFQQLHLREHVSYQMSHVHVRVNVDIDVPLFLPLYGQRRLDDLQRIARREKRSGHRIRGQMNFDSGWEWCYWLNDVITARASWNPFPGGAEEEMDPATRSRGSQSGEETQANVYAEVTAWAESASDSTSIQWKHFSAALHPLVQIFPPEIGDRVRTLLVNLTRIQEDLLIYGRVEGKPCPDLSKLTGIAYMSGVDTWVDLPRRLGLPLTQPNKILMSESGDELWPHVIPLLTAMEKEFSGLSAAMEQVYIDAEVLMRRSEAGNGERSTRTVMSDSGLSVLSELRDCLLLLSMRASQIRVLYESSDRGTQPNQKAVLLTQSRAIISLAAEVVERREAAYRVPWQRIAAWRDNPTVYRFGYLWSVHSLYYWWRDQGLAEQGSLQSERSPCYLNRMDASEVVAGWGKYTLEFIRNAVNRYFPFLSGYSALEFLNCIAPPEKEYRFPQDLYNY